MRSKTKTRNSIIVVVVAAAAIGGLLFWKHHHDIQSQQASAKTASQTGKVNSVNYGPPTAAQKSAGESTKESLNDSATGSGGSSSSSGDGTISISRVSQVISSGVVSLRTIVSGLSTGTCKATFSLTGQTSVQRTVDVINDATYYSCAPIDVPVSSFGASGNWNVSVSVVDSQGASASNTATGTVQIQK